MLVAVAAGAALLEGHHDDIEDLEDGQDSERQGRICEYFIGDVFMRVYNNCTNQDRILSVSADAWYDENNW